MNEELEQRIKEKCSHFFQTRRTKKRKLMRNWNKEEKELESFEKKVRRNEKDMILKIKVEMIQRM